MIWISLGPTCAGLVSFLQLNISPVPVPARVVVATWFPITVLLQLLVGKDVVSDRGYCCKFPVPSWQPSTFSAAIVNYVNIQYAKQ